MSKVNWDVAVAFAVESGSTYDPTLDAVTNSLSGDPDGTDDGLVLGDSESGIGGSGLSLTMGRKSRDTAMIGSSFTRGLSDFLALEARTLQFSFPLCGNRGLTTGTPVDGDFVPLTGVDAMLRAAGLTGAAWGSGVGHRYVTGGTETMSALIYYYGNRLELRNCRVSGFSVSENPGGIAIATADIAVGDVKDPTASGGSAAAIPATLDYGPQLSVSAPTTELVNNVWGQTRGWQSLVWAINNTVADIEDSNAVDGEVKAFTDQAIDVAATFWVDDTSEAEIFELEQALADAIGDLSQLSFTNGTPETTGGLPAVAHQFVIADPELDQTGPEKLGTQAGNIVTLRARSATANTEFELIFE